MKKGDLLWHAFKISGIILSLITMMTLTANRYTSETVHDFPPVRTPAEKTTPVQNDHRNKLTDFLIVYPSLTAIALAFMMDFIGHVFKDPLRKCSSIVLSGLSFILSLVAFTISTLATIRTHFATLVATAVCSGFLVIVTILDLILLMFS